MLRTTPFAHLKENAGIRLISSKKMERILNRHAAWIDTVSARYGIPSSAIKAILCQEMSLMDLGDIAADLVVRSNLFRKKDSSTGYAQIFGYVGLNAANFAVDRGLASYESLGIRSAHRLDSSNPQDVRLMWKLLHSSEKANIELATLNLLAAADEVVGRIDFDTFSAEELKLVFTRYNANVRHVTSYGEQVYERYLAFELAR